MAQSMEESIRQLHKLCPASLYQPNKPAPDRWIQSIGGLPGTKSQGDAVWFESAARVRASIGGNRAGKTTKLVLELGAMAIGCRPWYSPKSEWYTFGLKTEGSKRRDGRMRMRYVMPSIEQHSEETMEQLSTWWPDSMWKVKSRNEKGKVTSLEWFTGSVVKFMSHHQRLRDFEGVEVDSVYYDEPPPPEYYAALNRGTVSTGGRIQIGATLLDSSSWLWDIIRDYEAGFTKPEDLFISWHSIWDNTAENGGCPAQKAKHVIQWLRDDIADETERKAREHGYPMNVGGPVLSRYKEEVNTVAPHDLPMNSIILCCIDPAGSKPFAALWTAFFPMPSGQWHGVHFDELWDVGHKDDLVTFSEIWHAKENGLIEPIHPSRCICCIIDPAANEPQKADDYGRTMKQILEEKFGIATETVSRQNKRARLLHWNAGFGKGERTVWSTCVRFHQERRRYNWDPDSPKLTSGPDDIMDCGAYTDSVADDFCTMESGLWVPTGFEQPSNRMPDGRIRGAGRR
jgi:phage terminase large subunit-like protein